MFSKYVSIGIKILTVPIIKYPVLTCINTYVFVWAIFNYLFIHLSVPSPLRLWHEL